MLKRTLLTIRRILRYQSMEYLIDTITKRRIRDRKGNCNNCGSCCHNQETGRKCEYLKEKGECTVYEERRKKAFWCVVDWPLSPIDLEKTGLKGKCSYHWEEK